MPLLVARPHAERLVLLWRQSRSTQRTRELSQARVIQRVAAGGHDVPDEKLFARFPRTLENLAQAIVFVNEARLYDNSDAERPYRLLGRTEDGTVVERHPPLPEWARAALG